MKRLILLVLISILWLNSYGQLFFSHKRCDTIKTSFNQYVHQIQLQTIVKKYPTLFAKYKAQIEQIFQIYKNLPKNWKCYNYYLQQYTNDNYMIKNNIQVKKFTRHKAKDEKRAVKYADKFINDNASTQSTILRIYNDIIKNEKNKVLTNKNFHNINTNNNQPSPTTLKALLDSIDNEINSLNNQKKQLASQINKIQTQNLKKVEFQLKQQKITNQILLLKYYQILLLKKDTATTHKLIKQYKINTNEPNKTTKTNKSNNQQIKQSQNKKPGNNQQNNEQNRQQNNEQNKNRPNNQAQVITQYDYGLIPILLDSMLYSYMNLNAQDSIRYNKVLKDKKHIQKVNSVLQQCATSEDVIDLLTQDLHKYYFDLYKNLYELYIPRISGNLKPKLQHAYNVALELYKRYEKTDDENYAWQAAALMANTALLAEKYFGMSLGNQISRNLTLLIPQIPTKTHTVSNTKPTKPTKTTKPATSSTTKKCSRLSNTFYVYDITNTKPRILKETGTHYRVYVTMTTRHIPPLEFKNYQPLVYQKCIGSSLKKYYVGDYHSLSQAQKAAAQLKKLQLKTRVVKFVNGKPVKTYSTAVKSTSTAPKANYQYGIQVGSYKHKLSQDQFKQIYGKLLKNYPISILYKNGKYIYYVPAGKDYNFAKNQLLIKVKQLGYKDAFIINVK